MVMSQNEENKPRLILLKSNCTSSSSLKGTRQSELDTVIEYVEAHVEI